MISEGNLFSRKTLISAYIGCFWTTLNPSLQQNNTVWRTTEDVAGETPPAGAANTSFSTGY